MSIEKPMVEVFSRQKEDLRRIQSIIEDNAQVELVALDMSLPLSEIYFGIDWEA